MSQICLKYFILIAEGCLPSPCLLAGKRFHPSRATLGLPGGAGVGRNKSLVQVSPLSSPQGFSLGLPVLCWAGSSGHPASLL